MALPPISNSNSMPDSFTSVHHKETTEHRHIELSYRETLILLDGEEYYAAQETYKRLDALDGKDRHGNMDDCRRGAWYAVHLQTGLVRVLSSSCRMRWCPLCVRTKVGVIVKNLTPWIQKRCGPKFLTLTLKHSRTSLDEQVTRLYACFQQLRRRKYWKENVRSGVWFFQVKVSKESGDWHPHLHCVLDAEYMPHKVLKTMWLDVTGDSTIVDIKAVRDPKKVAEYVARYAARPCNLKDLTEAHQTEVVETLHGRRLCGKWGDCKDLELTVKPASVGDEYVVVCDYGKLSDLCKISVFAEQIRTAYRTRQPLNLKTTKDNLDNCVSEMWAKTRPPPKVTLPDPELILWPDDKEVPNCYTSGF